MRTKTPDIARLQYEIYITAHGSYIVIGWHEPTDQWQVFHRYNGPGTAGLSELEYWFAKPTLAQAFQAVGQAF